MSPIWKGTFRASPKEESSEPFADLMRILILGSYTSASSWQVFSDIEIMVHPGSRLHSRFWLLSTRAKIDLIAAVVMATVNMSGSGSSPGLRLIKYASMGSGMIVAPSGGVRWYGLVTVNAATDGPSL